MGVDGIKIERRHELQVASAAAKFLSVDFQEVSGAAPVNVSVREIKEVDPQSTDVLVCFEDAVNAIAGLVAGWKTRAGEEEMSGVVGFLTTKLVRLRLVRFALVPSENLLPVEVVEVLFLGFFAW